MSYVYRQSENESLDSDESWSVGFYKPDGEWEAESEWRTAPEAAHRVRELNATADAELLEELSTAHQIILNALAVMTIEQKLEWDRLNVRDGVESEGVTRHDERQAVLDRWAAGDEL